MINHNIILDSFKIDIEELIEVDETIEHKNKAEPSNIRSSKNQDIDDIRPETWNNIPFPLVDCIK